MAGSAREFRSPCPQHCRNRAAEGHLAEEHDRLRQDCGGSRVLWWSRAADGGPAACLWTTDLRRRGTFLVRSLGREKNGQGLRTSSAFRNRSEQGGIAPMSSDARPPDPPVRCHRRWVWLGHGVRDRETGRGKVQGFAAEG